MKCTESNYMRPGIAMAATAASFSSPDIIDWPQFDALHKNVKVRLTVGNSEAPVDSGSGSNSSLNLGGGGGRAKRGRRRERTSAIRWRRSSREFNEGVQDRAL